MEDMYEDTGSYDKLDPWSQSGVLQGVYVVGACGVAVIWLPVVARLLDSLGLYRFGAPGEADPPHRAWQPLRGRTRSLVPSLSCTDSALRWSEVVQLLAALQPPAGSPGGLPELREWAQALPRLVGLSQKATLEVCRRMADCIGAERPPKGELTRESLQQAFVRIGGAREVINAMVLHSDSADSVLACLRCMSAATQGAPFAAETLELQAVAGGAAREPGQGPQRAAAPPGVARRGGPI
ncbi:unnamed protein product [Prorocentrum cordatum]|uniref:Uncharacterized protein n=1 Tax=Prorocentrum cordatum TaxID=2364126 RepID=A0ABN9YHM5_9DINO|nr:unnamed protein product [Polarella glacialis]